MKKIYILSVFAILILSLSVSKAYALEDNHFQISTKMHFPKIIHPQEKMNFSITVRNLKTVLYVENIKPIFDISPKSVSSYVHIETKPVEKLLWPGDVDTIYGAIQIDKNISAEKIFISTSFEAMGAFKVPIFSRGQTDTAWITIDKNNSEKTSNSMDTAICGNSDFPTYGCGVTVTVRLDSPLKQFKSGIPTDQITCKQGLELVMKKSNNQPVCVKGTSVKTLTLRNYIPEYNGSLGGEIPSDDSESLIESRHIEITGVINHWQPIDGPAYSLITDKPINAQVGDVGIFLYGDMLRPYMKDQTVTIKGTLIPNYVEYQRSLGFSMMSGDPSTATILVDEIQIQQESKLSKIKELLIQNQIDYHPDKLVVTGGPTIQGDSGCGAVIDVDSTTHWFIIDSISNPKNMKLFSENPGMCRVNGGSCFCNAQIELTALTLKKLSYFTSQEEEKYSNILIDYLGKENINRTPKFMIGKLNLNYTDFSAIGYCGKMWGENDYGFFSGAIANDRVMDYGIDKESPKLCAISNDAHYFGKAFGEK